MDRSLHHLIAFAALAVITVGVYSAVFTHGFVDWDDPTLITQNPYVTEFSPKIFSTYDPELYVPLTLLTYQIEHAIAGLKPFLFHLDNLILHILNVLLVFLLFYTRTKDRALAFLGALIFAVHPLNVEAVAWVSARKESLMTFFFLTSILATQKSDRNWDKWHIGSIALFACSLLSKVTAAPLPLLLMFLDRRDGLSLRESLRKRWPYLLLALILGVVALFGKRGSIGLDPLSFVILAVQSIAFYIQKLLLPIDLAAFYSAPPITLSLQFFIALLTILFVCVVGWLLRRHQNVLFGLVFFLLTLAPSLFGYQKANEIALAADRYAYLPSIGWILFVGSLALLLKSNLRKIAAGVALVAAVAMMPMTYMQAKTWENTQSLFLHLIQVDPTSAIAKNNLGFLLISRGMLPEALIMVEEALAENPDYVDALVNKGVIKGRQGKLSESEAALRRAIEIDPESAQAHFNLGGVYFVRGQWAQAEAQYNETLRINPYHEDAKRQLEAVRQKI